MRKSPACSPLLENLYKCLHCTLIGRSKEGRVSEKLQCLRFHRNEVMVVTVERDIKTLAVHYIAGDNGDELGARERDGEVKMAVVRFGGTTCWRTCWWSSENRVHHYHDGAG